MTQDDRARAGGPPGDAGDVLGDAEPAPYFSLARAAWVPAALQWDSSTGELQRQWHRLLGRPVSEYGRLCHGDGPTDGATAPPEGASVGYPQMKRMRILPLGISAGHL